MCNKTGQIVQKKCIPKSRTILKVYPFAQGVLSLLLLMVQITLYQSIDSDDVVIVANHGKHKISMNIVSFKAMVHIVVRPCL